MLGIKNLIEQHRNDDEHLAIDKIEKIRKIVEDSADIVKKAEDIDYLHILRFICFCVQSKNYYSANRIIIPLCPDENNS